MKRMSSTRQFSLRQESDHSVRTSLLDNWRYQTPMARSPHSLPSPRSRDKNQLSLGCSIGFNINEDDLDCPGHGSCPLTTSVVRSSCGHKDNHLQDSNSSEDLHKVCMATSSSSEGLYDSGEEDEDRRIRAMSVDEVQLHRCDDDSNNNIRFGLPHSEDDDTEWEVDVKTPTGPTPQARRTKVERRASVDSGVLGMGEGLKSTEDLGAGGWQRNALTEPGTPAEPCTPVASYVSLEQLMADSQYLVKKLQPLLCAERVSQMTRTYNDIEAVTSVLDENERDLELAARIGQTLLSRNQDLSDRKEVLEEQLSLANDTIKQLKHELSKKVQQLEVYDQDLQSQSSQDDSFSSSGGAPGLSSTAVEKLQRRVGTLEEENLNLLRETAQLRSDTESYKEKEKKRGKDSLQQFAELNQKVDVLTEELQMKEKENSRQREEISSLVTQLNDACQRVRQLTEENADLLDKLQAAEESQTQLSRELNVQKDKYDELFETLERTHDELRSRSQGSKFMAMHHSHSNSPDAVSEDSLASELQHSLHLELSQSDDRKANRPRNWKVFETARAAHKAASKSRSNSFQLSSSALSCWDADSFAASIASSDAESFISDGYSGDLDSVCGSARELGQPGVPGSNDLQTALQRLAMRHGHDTDEFKRAQQDHRSEGMSPFRMPGTPDTMSSTPSGCSYLGCSKNLQSSSQYKMSSKLQIVKPMEGSVTLQQWQRLAQPHLGGLFERRDGVNVKGERKLDLEEETYTISDFEEDEDVTDCPSGLLDSSGGQVFTPSLVSPLSQHSPARHHSFSQIFPSHHSHNPASYRGLPSHHSSRRASVPVPKPVSSSTPQSHVGSKKGSGSSSYSMSLGLAAILQDRDTSLARAVMKTSADCSKIPVESLADKSIPVIPAESVATASSTSSQAPLSSPYRGSPSTDSPGLFGKLISSGYSLLWNKSDVPTSLAPASALSHETVPADHIKGAKNPTANQLFPRGGTGVLSAITTLRKNGIL